jgi:putative redox protein
VDAVIDAGGVKLKGHLARPPASAAAGAGRFALILCHGFPAGPRGAAKSAETYPDLADRLANDAGWVVLSFNFRGTGDSEGDFSLGGWMADIRAAIDHVLAVDGVQGVWLAGFSTGGALAICMAAEDDRVAGVAALSAPAEFDDWAADPQRFLAYAREVGVIHGQQYPTDFAAWSAELREIRAASAVGKIPPRPLLLVHGSEDDIVPVVDARQLADAADGNVELRVLTGAGHRLRHDPRAIAVLLGWLDRQHL